MFRTSSRYMEIVVCPVELCWLYSLFEKRISENVIQARVVIVEYYVNNIHSEDK